MARQSTHGVLPTGRSPYGDGAIVQQYSKRLVDSGAVYPRAVSPVGTHPMVITNEGGVRESSQGETVDGDGVFPRRDSELMAREPSHGEAVSRW